MRAEGGAGGPPLGVSTLQIHQQIHKAYDKAVSAPPTAYTATEDVSAAVASAVVPAHAAHQRPDSRPATTAPRPRPAPAGPALPRNPLYVHVDRSLTVHACPFEYIETVGGLRFVRTSRGGEERRSVARGWGDCLHVTAQYPSRVGSRVH